MIKVCAYCGKEFNSRRSKFKFCSHECGNRSRWTEDESVFQNGIGPEEAYIIGFICADGCISYDAHSGRYRITIATKDKELIEYFHRRMTPNKSIYFSKGCYSIVSNNRFDIEFLKQLGIWERKTSVFSMPVIDKSLISHLIRGYFDGDGCAYKSTTTQKAYSKTYTYTYVSFTTGSYESALDVQCLLSVYGIETSLIQDSRKNETYYVKILKVDSVKKFYDLIYKDATIYLERKQTVFPMNNIVRPA